MNPYHHIWRDWYLNLHRWGVNHLVAALLEAAGPLAILGAQAVYLGEPFIKPVWPDERWQALIALMEDPGETQRFAAFLRDQEDAV